MQDDTDIFPVASERRRIMLLCLCGYVIASGMALWLWRDGAGAIWAWVAIVAGLLIAHVLVSLLRRRWVARLTPDTVETMGLWGKITRLPLADLHAHSLHDGRNTGALHAGPETPGGKERFAIVSLGMMGTAGAARFRQMLLAQRPDLEERRTPMDQAFKPETDTGTKPT